VEVGRAAKRNEPAMSPFFRLCRGAVPRGSVYAVGGRGGGRSGDRGPHTSDREIVPILRRVYRAPYVRGAMIRYARGPAHMHTPPSPRRAGRRVAGAAMLHGIVRLRFYSRRTDLFLLTGIRDPPSRRFGRLSVRVLPCRRPSRAQISIK
jgi:hypothetical protein